MDHQMKAVIMAGGKGTRLFPYTAVLPKPLMPVGDIPILELLLRQLRSHGVRDVVLAVNHMHHLIRSFFGDGAALDLKIEYWVEDVPLGTCGAIAGFLHTLSSSFFLMNGDLLTNNDFSKMAESHIQAGASATVATYSRTFKVDFGVLKFSSDNLIYEYVEKPEIGHNISMGIYILERDRVRKFLGQNEYKDMPELIMDLIKSSEPVNNFSANCVWLDIGNPDDYGKAQRLVADNRSVFFPAGPSYMTTAPNLTSESG